MGMYACVHVHVYIYACVFVCVHVHVQLRTTRPGTMALGYTRDAIRGAFEEVEVGAII